jgi:hypothetical protein
VSLNLFFFCFNASAGMGATHKVDLLTNLKKLETKSWISIGKGSPAAIAMEKLALDGLGLSEVSVPGDQGDPTPEGLAWSVGRYLANDPKTFWNKKIPDSTRAEIKANLSLIQQTFNATPSPSTAIGSTWVLHIIGDDAGSKKLLLKYFQEEVERGMQQKTFGYSSSDAEFFCEGIEKLGTEKEKIDAAEKLTKMKVHLSNIMPPQGGGSGT